MRSISDRDVFWKTISVIIIIILVTIVTVGNLILASPFYATNDFKDYKHPVSAKWNTEKMQAGQGPDLDIKFEPDSVTIERFYDYFHIPDVLRLDLSFVNFIFLIMAIGVFYCVCLSLIVRDEELEGILLGWTVIFPQILLFGGLLVSSLLCYQDPDLTILGINDTQMAQEAGNTVFLYVVLTIFIMLLMMFLADIVIGLLSLLIINLIHIITKKIKDIIINRITLGQNIMLCCNNGNFELISIDFELKWIPFPAMFLRRRVLDAFSVSGASSRRLFREWLDGLSIAVEEEHIQKLAQLNMNGGSLLISPDDSVSIVRLESAIKWRLFPKKVVHREIVRRVSFDNFFRCLTADSKQVALNELQGLLTASYKDRFKGVGRLASLALIKSLCAKTLKALKIIVPQVVADQDNLASQNATKLLQELTDEKLSAFKQEIVASIQEALQLRVSRNIKERILAPLRDILAEQLPLVNSSGSIDALPEGTKFFFSHGGRQIVIVEQKPQLRSLHFSRTFVGGGGRYNLALPYVIFLIIFRNGEFERMNLYYANKPMTSLDSEVFSTNLPNINRDENSVCTGFGGCRETSLAGKVEEVIAHFWQSEFNNDLHAGYEFISSRGGAFRNLSTWQKASQRDPLFVLRVDWRPCDRHYAPSAVISDYMDGTLTSKIANFDHLISQVLQSEGINIGELARQCCENISIDRRYSKKATSALREYLVKLSHDICQAIESKLSSLVQLPDEKSLFDDVNSATAQAVEETITQDFYKHASQVLLRRRVGSQELINQILNQR